MITDDELRINHDFVMAFETLRKRYGHREMKDAALQDVADATGVRIETLRIFRHLRNALAHGEAVNRETLVRYHGVLTRIVDEPAPTVDHASGVTLALNRRAYRVHAWKDPTLERLMIANGFVSIGGEEIGDLTGVQDPEFIRASLTTSMPERTDRAISLFTGYWRRFLWEAEPGDIVVLPTRNGDVAIGEFVGPYHYVKDDEPRARHRRAVSWDTVDVDRGAFDPDLLVTLNGQHTVQEFKGEDAARRIRALTELPER